MFDDERVERLNVGIESEIFLRRDVLTSRRTVSQPLAVVVVVSPDQFLAGGFRRDLLSLLPGLIKLLPSCKHFPEGILTDDRLPVYRVENRLAPRQWR